LNTLLPLLLVWLLPLLFLHALQSAGKGLLVSSARKFHSCRTSGIPGLRLIVPIPLLLPRHVFRLAVVIDAPLAAVLIAKSNYDTAIGALLGFGLTAAAAAARQAADTLAAAASLTSEVLSAGAKGLLDAANAFFNLFRSSGNTEVKDAGDAAKAASDALQEAAQKSNPSTPAPAGTYICSQHYDFPLICRFQSWPAIERAPAVTSWFFKIKT
jgi:hypothetical protein